MRDNGDPLLFIESVPYYETRAYLNAVLRNYFVYQMEQQGQLAGAQGDGAGHVDALSGRQEDRGRPHVHTGTSRPCRLTRLCPSSRSTSRS